MGKTVYFVANVPNEKERTILANRIIGIGRIPAVYGQHIRVICKDNQCEELTKIFMEYEDFSIYSVPPR